MSLNASIWLTKHLHRTLGFRRNHIIIGAIIFTRVLVWCPILKLTCETGATIEGIPSRISWERGGRLTVGTLAQASKSNLISRPSQSVWRIKNVCEGVNLNSNKKWKCPSPQIWICDPIKYEVWQWIYDPQYPCKLKYVKFPEHRMPPACPKESFYVQSNYFHFTGLTFQTSVN